MAKLLSQIISTKILETIRVSEEQHGFRRNKPTVDAIFILRQLTEKAVEYEKLLFLCFVDLKQAFDRIKPQDIKETLHKHKVHEQLIAIVQEMNTDNYTQIKTEREMSEKNNSIYGHKTG